MKSYFLLFYVTMCYICKSILCQKEVCAMLQYIISLKQRKGIHFQYIIYIYAKDRFVYFTCEYCWNYS